jgi:hypothetical protein
MPGAHINSLGPLEKFEILSSSQVIFAGEQTAAMMNESPDTCRFGREFFLLCREG